jgi:hypothetical protein
MYSARILAGFGPTGWLAGNLTALGKGRLQHVTGTEPFLIAVASLPLTRRHCQLVQRVYHQGNSACKMPQWCDTTEHQCESGIQHAFATPE